MSGPNLAETKHCERASDETVAFMGGDIAEKKSPKEVIDICSIVAHI